MKLADVKSIQELKQETHKRLDEIEADSEAGKLTPQEVHEAHERAFLDYAKALREKALQEKKACCLHYRGALEWGQIHTREDWEKLLAESRRGYMDGQFFLERIGRRGDVDHQLVATLLELRQSWITEYQIETAPEFLLVDMALVSYFHFIRLNEAVNNLEFLIEREFFQLGEPTVKYDGMIPRGWKVEDYAKQFQVEMLPQLDRLNRMFLRNLKALRELRRANIELYIGQVNIGRKQVNLA